VLEAAALLDGGEAAGVEVGDLVGERLALGLQRLAARGLQFGGVGGAGGAVAEDAGEAELEVVARAGQGVAVQRALGHVGEGGVVVGAGADAQGGALTGEGGEGGGEAGLLAVAIRGLVAREGLGGRGGAGVGEGAAEELDGVLRRGVRRDRLEAEGGRGGEGVGGVRE
jgi:hypothetical protein